MLVSIITATFNSRALIPILANSLLAQSDKDFEWVVADGGSTDGTLELLKDYPELNITVIQRDDFGIYDAINGAIKKCTGQYYVVAGSDDYFHADAIANFKREIAASNADMVTSRLNFCGTERGVLGGDPAINRQFAFVSGHAVSTAFRTALHEKFGYYSNKFPIAADQDFILKAAHAGATIHRADFVSGSFEPGGISGRDFLGTLTESFRIQVKYHNKFQQMALFFYKVIRYYRTWR
jgi:glycosyltransferase involved in cell wall biosynthesis